MHTLPSCPSPAASFVAVPRSSEHTLLKRRTAAISEEECATMCTVELQCSAPARACSCQPVRQQELCCVASCE